MQYRNVPKNGDQLSALGYGTMRLPTTMGRIDEERAIRQIRSAIDSGVNYIDTAMPYHGGESERVVGKALADGYREKVRLATKLTPWNVKKREDMDRILDAQLKRLRSACIDYYLLHSLDAVQWKKLRDLGVLEFVDSALGSGKIQNAGFSFHGDRRTFREIIEAYPWICCQIQYNFLDENNQAGTEGLRYAASRGIAVMVMEPLRGGTLVRNLPREVSQEYAQFPVRRSAAAWALRWVWNHPEVTVVLSGMNDEGHIAENLETCSHALPGSMSRPELETIRRVAAVYRRLATVGCTGCSYCMPCPSGVNIPYCLSLYNDYRMGHSRLITRGWYGLRLMGGQDAGRSDASLCQNCGRCERACPQKIPIPDELQKVDQALGGIRTQIMLPLIRMIIRRKPEE